VGFIPHSILGKATQQAAGYETQKRNKFLRSKKMKKFTATVQTLFLKPVIAALVLTSCASVPPKSGAAPMPLEEAIEQSAFEISESFPAKTKIVVIKFDSLATELSEYIMEELNGVLIQQRKLTVIDRANLELIAKEMNFQLSGSVSDESMLALGRMLGAQYIAVGSLEDANSAYRYRLYATNVESSSREAAVMLNVRKDQAFAERLQKNKKTSSVVEY
jgi:TolB-like protein